MSDGGGGRSGRRRGFERRFEREFCGVEERGRRRRRVEERERGERTRESGIVRWQSGEEGSSSSGVD